MNRTIEEWAKDLSVNWQPIDTAPQTGREKILLKTPYSPEGCPAYSNTWWTAGFSVECKPTHWKPFNETLDLSTIRASGDKLSGDGLGLALKSIQEYKGSK